MNTGGHAGMLKEGERVAYCHMKRLPGDPALHEQMGEHIGMLKDGEQVAYYHKEVTG